MFNMVVLAKQVPDTHNVTADAMKADGTVNRSALPTVFNPEDLHALEAALRVKETWGGHITVLTMGPPTAAEILRDSLYRGADRVILLTDRKFAGADTLATSYALAQAIRKIGAVDLIFTGRQAIDGDTAQVGPQVAEKLGFSQIGYLLEIQDLKKREIRIRRQIDGGTEVVRSALPALITVTEQANEPRYPSVKRIAKYKKAMAHSELAKVLDSFQYLAPEQYSEDYLQQEGLLIEEWELADIGADPAMCGLAGSPTKVYKIENVVLEARDSREYTPTEAGVGFLVHELTREHIIG